MKLALIIEAENRKCIVLTPQSEEEKSILAIIEGKNATLSVEKDYSSYSSGTKITKAVIDLTEPEPAKEQEENTHE